MIQWNTRTKIILYIILAFIYLGGVFIWGLLMDSEAYAVDYSVKFLQDCGCQRYYQYNQELLFDEKRRKLLERLQ